MVPVTVPALVKSPEGEMYVVCCAHHMLRRRGHVLRQVEADSEISECREVERYGVAHDQRTRRNSDAWVIH